MTAIAEKVDCLAAETFIHQSIDQLEWDTTSDKLVYTIKRNTFVTKFDAFSQVESPNNQTRSIG